MCSPGAQAAGRAATDSEDLLTRILREFDEHCSRLEPQADEYQQVMAARDALIAGLAGKAERARRPRARKSSARRRRLDDGELLELVFEQVRRYPGITPAQVGQVLGYSTRERARLVVRPLSRLHRLGRIDRDGEGFRVAADA